MAYLSEEMIRDITIVVRDEYETALDVRQIAEQEVNSEEAHRAGSKVETLEWVLSLLECDYPEELYELYGEVLEVEKSNEL